MSRWRIQHGNIAAVIYVEPEHGHGPKYTCIGGTPGKWQTEAYRDNNMARDVWSELPLKVRAAVNRDFGVVFSLPHDGRDSPRDAFVRDAVPYIIEE